MNRLRELRQKNNLTLKELGQKTGMANNTLSQYETGKREPKLETWNKLANYFDVPILYLQGFGLSNEQATEMAWKWVHNEGEYANHPMNHILRDFFKTHFSKEELKNIFKNKQTFSEFMNKRFQSVFNYDSLSKMESPEDLENQLVIVAGGATRSGVMDSILAQIHNIDFKKDSNEQIHNALDEIITDLFMYIDNVN